MKINPKTIDKLATGWLIAMAFIFMSFIYYALYDTLIKMGCPSYGIIVGTIMFGITIAALCRLTPASPR